MNAITDAHIVRSTKKIQCVNCKNATLTDTMFLVELASGESGPVCATCHPEVMAAGCLVAKRRLLRLPKWAQGRIQLLAKNLARAQEQLRQITSGDSPIRWNDSPVRDSDRWQGIPARATLRIALTTGTLELQLRHGVLQVRNNDHGRIMVQPCYHNSLEINVQPREAGDAAVLMEILRKMETADRYQDMSDSGIEKCFRCNVPVGDGHGFGCPYHPLPLTQS